MDGERWSRVHVPNPFLRGVNFSLIGSGHYSFVHAKLLPSKPIISVSHVRSPPRLRKLVNHYLQKLVCGLLFHFLFLLLLWLCFSHACVCPPPTYGDDEHNYTFNRYQRWRDCVEERCTCDVFSNYLAHKKHGYYMVRTRRSELWHHRCGDAGAGAKCVRDRDRETAPRVTDTVAKRTESVCPYTAVVNGRWHCGCDSEVAQNAQHSEFRMD